MEDSGIESDHKLPTVTTTANHTNDETIILPSNDNISSSNHQTQQSPQQQQSTTKQLRKILEARIEQAKKIQRCSTDTANMVSTKSTGLIPIRRLPIPHHSGSLMHHEHYPLIEYWQNDTTDSDDETTLFPLSRGKQENCNNNKQNLTDTFSIQELSEESEDSLNLIGPTVRHSTYRHTQICKSIECLNCLCHIL